MTKLITIFDKDLNQRVFRLFYENEIIHKIDTSITISSSKSSIDVGENVILSGVLSDAGGNVLSGKNVRILKNNVLVDTVTTDSNGTYSKTISGLSAGTYHFHASFAGDDTYDNALSSTIDVNVLSHVYVVTLLSDKQSILSSESVTLSGTVTRDSEGYAGQSVRLFDGVTLVDTLTTDSNGDFSKTLSNLSVGTHRFFAQFDAYESSIVVVEVQDHDYAINISADNPIIQTGDTAIITATLTDGSNPVVGETLSYSLTNKGTVVGSGSTTTNNNGEISITYVGAGLGDIDVEVSYSTLLQETYEIEDLWYYDPCTSDKGHWSDNTGLAFDINGMLITKETILDISYPSAYVVEFTLVEPTGSYYTWTGGVQCANVGVIGANTDVYWQTINPYDYYTERGNRFVAGDKIKFVVENGSASIYLNDVLKRTVTATNNKFKIVSSPDNANHLKIKDLTIKAL